MADIGIKIGVEGEKAFKSALKSINDELKVSASEMQMLAAKYDGNEKSVEALTEKQKALEKQLAGQKEAVKTISEALENAKNSFGEADARTLAWQKKLNDAEAAVYKTEKAIRDNDAALEALNDETGDAAKSEAELKAAAEKTAKEMEEQKKKVDEAKKTLLEYAKAAQDKAAKALKALTAAAAASVTAVSALVLSAGSAADELSDMSKKTGLSTTALQKYDYAAKMAGTSLETITGAQAKLVKQMGAARDESSSAAKKFAELGVSVKDASGKLRDTDDVFMDVIDSLGKIDNEAERDAAAMDIFGKSAQELNPLILEGSEGLKKYNEEAERLGVIVSEDNVGALADMQGKVKEITAQFDALKMNLAAKFAPIAKQVLEKVQKIISNVQKTLDSPQMKAAIDKLGKALKNFLDKAADLAEKILPHLVSAVTFVIENFDKLAISLGVIWGIFKGVQVVQGFAKAFTAVKAALETLRASSTAATSAVEGMSSAMGASATAAAGWIGVIVAAVGALIALDSTLSKRIEEAKAKASESSQQLRDEISTAKSEFDRYNKTFSDTKTATEETAKKAEEYIDRLKELEKQSALTVEEQEEYKGTIKKLQVLMPNLNLQLDKNTGLLKDGADALNEQIENWKKLSKLEATKSALTDAYKNQFELDRLQKNASERFREISDLYWRFNELQNEQGVMQSPEKMRELQEITHQLTGENYDWVNSVAAADAAYTEARSAMNEAFFAASENGDLISELERDYLNLSDEIEETTDSEEDFTEEINDASEAVDEHAKKIDELAEKHYEKLLDAAHDLFNKLSEETELSMKEITDTLKHNREVIQNYERNLKTIYERGASEDVLTYLEGLGLEQAGVIDMIAHSTDKEFENFIKAFDRNTAVAKESGSTWGKTIGDAIIKGMDSKLSEIEKAAVRMAKKVEKGFKTTLEINSPSRVMYQATGYVGDAVVLSLNNARSSVEKASESLARAVELGFDPSIGAAIAATPAGALSVPAGFPTRGGNTYNYYISDPSDAYMRTIMQNVNNEFGGLYA